MRRRIRGMALLMTLLVLPLHAAAAAPAGPSFRIDPATLAIQSTAGVIAFAEVTLTNVTPFPLVVPNSATFSGPGADRFNDTQAGSCWQSYGALGEPIPGQTSCTIQISFLSATAGTFQATMTVTRCTAWEIDPDFGFIVCTAFDGSRSIRVTGTAVPAPLTTRHIYLADGDGIARATIDGQNHGFFIQVCCVSGLAVNESHIYWSNSDFNLGATVGRANIDGTNVNNALVALPDNWVALDVAIDATYVYWVAREEKAEAGYEPGGRIGRADLDGGNANHTFIDGIDHPWRLDIDSSNVYWTTYPDTLSPDAIGRANLDGSGVQQSFVALPSAPGDIAVNPTHIFWKNSSGIARSNLDGSGLTNTFIAMPQNADWPLGLDLDSQKLYFDWNLRLHTANLDGTNLNNLNLFIESSSLAVDPE